LLLSYSVWGLFSWEDLQIRPGEDLQIPPYPKG
jgi:hypothetical protein